MRMTTARFDTAPHIESEETHQSPLIINHFLNPVTDQAPSTEEAMVAIACSTDTQKDEGSSVGGNGSDEKSIFDEGRIFDEEPGTFSAAKDSSGLAGANNAHFNGVHRAQPFETLSNVVVWIGTKY
jgi:hypothetical protein